MKLHLHALALPALATLAAASETGPFLDVSYDDARALAAKENKIVMIDFYTTWCGPCKKLDGFTWPVPEVQAWLFRNTIPLKVDAEANLRLKSMYEVNYYPSVVFLTPEGMELDRLAGYFDAQKFVNAAQLILSAQQDGDALTAAVERDPSDLRARMALADHLAGKKQYRPAMEHYFKLYDEGTAEEFQATRRGELLARIAHLGRLWPRAKSDLGKRRATALEALLSESGTADHALDLAALDVVLQKKVDTLRVFNQLAERGDATRDARLALLPTVFDQLIGPRQYDPINALRPDFMAQLERDLAAYDELASEFSKLEIASNMLGTRRGEIASRGSMYFEVLVTGDRARDAGMIADRLIELDPTSRTFLALARRAKRTGDLQLALAQVERGLETVPAEQNASLKQFGTALKRQIDASK